MKFSGRVHDPTLGRFLSPDNYVQMPDNTQSFNRYSYCINNPLKYVDPSGEFWQIFAIAALGGVFNWAVNGCQFNAEGLGYLAAGAAAAGITICSGQVVLGGAFLGGTNAWLSGGDVAAGAVFGGVTAFAGGALNSYFSQHVGGAILKFLGVDSPVLSGMIVGGTGSVLSGIATNFAFTFATTGSLDEAVSSAWKGITSSLSIGATTGAVYGIQYAHANKISPWTGEKIHKHHSYPKFLGGEKGQDLTSMSESRHRELHCESNEHLRNIKSEDGIHHMSPQKGNPGKEIRKNFTPETRFNAMKGFYDQHPIKYWDARFDFYRNNDILHSWRPWGRFNK